MTIESAYFDIINEGPPGCIVPSQNSKLVRLMPVLASHQSGQNRRWAAGKVPERGQNKLPVTNGVLLEVFAVF